ncbi:unnamed protein product [Rotaria socialis]|uniref:F-box domain-containing protein n=1 Tax=Rotaria socialis TaxID=392032 RepID=A0A820UCC6_9BILA|nr:unnamed protein product [Rotaria socialis]
MEYSSCIKLNDLPNEILMIILKNLHTIDVLYSLVGADKRLNAFVNDSIFTKYLTLMSSSPTGLSYSFTDKILDRFCEEILPEIHHKIEWLNVAPPSIERILVSTNYSNLRGLDLYDLSSDTAMDLFTDGSFFIRIFKNQILSLVIDIKKHKGPISASEDINKFIYTQIFTMFSNLEYLDFDPSFNNYHVLSFGVSPPNIFSSTLSKLNVMIHTYRDCLYLLDGRFNQLHTFYVTITDFSCQLSTAINNEHTTYLSVYNQFLVPLLHRMSNLEELSLFFLNHNRAFIDGDNLAKNTIRHMTRLNKFAFDIRTIISFVKLVNLPSNKEFQNTFRHFEKIQIISCVDYFQKASECHCHMYSYPYTLKYYKDITNNFTRGLFESVREISLFDERPFEHEFFLQIARSFPFLEKLILHNREPQMYYGQQWPTIEYPHLTQLDLVRTHHSYVEQFLNNTKMSLLNNVYLYVNYHGLQIVCNPYKLLSRRIIKHSLLRETLQPTHSSHNMIVSYSKPRVIIEVEPVRLPVIKIDP